MEQLTPWNYTNTLLLSTNFCAKTKETPVYQLLRAHLRIFDFTLYKFTRYYHYFFTRGKPVIIIIFFTRGKPLVAQKLQKKTTKLVWK